MEERLLNVKEASEQLGISVPKLRLLMASGEIGHVKIGRRTLLSAKTLTEFIEKHTIAPKAS
jgi:excisionase family DNA binding protein